MAYQAYINHNFNKRSQAIIMVANTIIGEYTAQGFTLTLRQLYYQFVARDLLPNSQQSYHRLGSVINKARLAGEIDWTALEDRTRNLRQRPNWDSPKEVLGAAAEQFQYDKWADQPVRVEVWIEKDALVGVIQRVCDDNQVPYFACRGYTSQSEQWRAGTRFINYLRNKQDVVVLHLGDHDPSGVDMTRDNEDRLRMFLSYEFDAESGGVDESRFEVRRLALNMDQVRKYDPPPNPAKFTDSRARAYVQRYGRQSWELDALSPPIIAGLIQRNINDIRHADTWDESVERERVAKDKLQDLADKWRDD